MEYEPNFPGLGKRLAGILNALDLEKSSEPVWKLKETYGKIYLDIVWSKTIPASTVTRQGKPLNHTQQQSSQLEKQLDRDKRVKASGFPGWTKKRKSPSQKKRDQQRRENWLQKKNKSCEPISPRVGSIECSTTSSTTVSRPTGVDHSAAKIPAVLEPSTPTSLPSTQSYNPSGTIRRRRILPTPPAPVFESPRQESPSSCFQKPVCQTASTQTTNTTDAQALLLTSSVPNHSQRTDQTGTTITSDCSDSESSYTGSELEASDSVDSEQERRWQATAFELARQNMMARLTPPSIRYDHVKADSKSLEPSNNQCSYTDCSAPDPSLMCSLCLIARYCDELCQKRDWIYHSEVCGKTPNASETDRHVTWASPCTS